MQIVISGGQTGVDRAALDAAMRSGFLCSGWCPKGRKSEAGRIPSHYPLQETPSEDYSQRTEWNVRDSGMTLVLYWNLPSGGTAFTIATATRLEKPTLLLDMDMDPDLLFIASQIQARGVQILNVAGPRESEHPGMIYCEAFRFLSVCFQSLQKHRSL